MKIMKETKYFNKDESFQLLSPGQNEAENEIELESKDLEKNGTVYPILSYEEILSERASFQQVPSRGRRNMSLPKAGYKRTGNDATDYLYLDPLEEN